MENLKETLQKVANKYAWQFGKVIGMRFDFWVGNEPELGCFGDDMFFTLNEMRQVVDNLPKYVKLYGSMEAVGYEIHKWTDWWLDGASDKMFERILPRVTQHLRPNISLKSWLDGCPRKDRDAWSGPDAELMKRETLQELLEEYCENECICIHEPIMHLMDRLGIERAQLRIEKDKRDKIVFEEFMKNFKNNNYGKKETF